MVLGLIPKIIVLHHSLTKDEKVLNWHSIRRYHKNVKKWDACGYHFGIELVRGNYEILMGRALDEVGAHVSGNNALSIGICFIGNFDLTEVPATQWKAGVRLVRGLCWSFKISPTKIYGHRYFDKGKTCPGELFNIIKFRKDVEEALDYSSSFRKYL